MSTEKKSTFRLKVQLAGKGLLIPISESATSGNVFGLAAEIATRFGIERIAELRTADGFQINLNDKVHDVIESGDVLVGLDYAGYLNENNHVVRDYVWFSVRREDFVDQAVKWADIGYAKNIRKFFVRLGGAQPHFPSILEMFSIEDLQHFAKEGKRLVASLAKEGSGWSSQAEFIVNAAGAVEAVELAVKSKSDARPHVVRFAIKLAPGSDAPCTKGEEKLIQNAEMPMEEVKYELPAPVYEGPAYKDPPLDKRTADEKKVAEQVKEKALEAFKAEGSLALQINLKSPIELMQIYSKNKPMIEHHAQVGFEMLARGSPVVVQKTLAQWKDADGKWQEAKVLRGRRNGMYTYAWERDSNTAFTVYSGQPQYIAFAHVIECKGLQFSQRRRTAKGLPDPIELKLTFTSTDGGSSSITYVHVNDPLQMRTIEQAKSEETKDEKFVFWTQCDDTEAEGRISVEGFLQADGSDGKRQKLVMTPMGMNNATYTITHDLLRKTGFEAAEKNLTEIPLPNFSQELAPNLEHKAFMVCDPKHKRAYAIKWVLKTNTSKSTASFLIPQLQL